MWEGELTLAAVVTPDPLLSEKGRRTQLTELMLFLCCVLTTGSQLNPHSGNIRNPSTRIPNCGNAIRFLLFGFVASVGEGLLGGGGVF